MLFWHNTNSVMLLVSCFWFSPQLLSHLICPTDKWCRNSLAAVLPASGEYLLHLFWILFISSGSSENQDSQHNKPEKDILILKFTTPPISRWCCTSGLLTIWYHFPEQGWNLFISWCFCHVRYPLTWAEICLEKDLIFFCMDWAGQREFTLLILVTVTDKRVGGYIHLEKLQTYLAVAFPFLFLLLSFFFFFHKEYAGNDT